MKIKIIFTDLTHTGMETNANTFPSGVSLVAAYAKQELGNLIDISIHKFPEELNEALRQNTPHILAMTTFVWNAKLNYSFAAYIKKVSPETVVVFGGPDFPIPPIERKDFLLERPAIDFFVKWDGEHAFLDLVNELMDKKLDLKLLKKNHITLKNLCYVTEDQDYIEGPDSRIEDLMTIPSPYTMGLLDRFFETPLYPLVEYTRGCPYGCTFCNDGNSFRNNVMHKSVDFIKEELEYIASKVKNTTILHLVDLNFGQYKHDIETAKILRSIINKYQYPYKIRGNLGKAQPARMLDVASIINEARGGVMKLGSSLQSTDAGVLKELKRKNLSLPQVLVMKDESLNQTDTQFSTELIVPLPGMTLETHMNDLRDVVDQLGMNSIEIHQLSLLKGSEMDTRSERKRLNLDSRYRVYVGAVGIYDIGDQPTPIAETEEMVVASDKMPIEDYLECRIMDLLIKILVDNDPYKELFQMLKNLHLSVFDLLLLFKDHHLKKSKSLVVVIEHYKDLLLNKLYKSSDEISTDTSDIEIIKKYILGELGANELSTCRVLVYSDYWEEFQKVFGEAVLDYLEKMGVLNEEIKDYAEEVLMLCKLRNFNYMDMSEGYMRKNIVREFKFDLISAAEKNFQVSQKEIKKNVKINFYYDSSDLSYLRKELNHFGEKSLHNIGKFIQQNNSLRTRRKVSYT
ncbi:MAG: hypothetical protein CMH70_01915 [Nitrosomonadaceae bacterium]|nr:hypothetical protein [Nitrosomonadaceae bacterium]